MIIVPASLPHPLTPAIGVTTNVPVMAVAAVLRVAEICAVLAPADVSSELSITFSVVPVNPASGGGICAEAGGAQGKGNAGSGDAAIRVLLQRY